PARATAGPATSSSQPSPRRSHPASSRGAPHQVAATAMPQNVPEFHFGDDDLRLSQFLYEHWCAHGRGPNLRTVHAATGLSRERRRSYVNWAGADLMPHRLPTVAGRRAAAAPGGADVRDAVSSNGARPETRTPSRARATTTSS